VDSDDLRRAEFDSQLFAVSDVLARVHTYTPGE
jgi:hypothetical protein